MLKEKNKRLPKDFNSLLNRTKSIKHDAEFVSFASKKFPSLPIFPNERAGTWYVNPNLIEYDTVYFKSTDGHTGNWDFSLKRLNLHLLEAISKRNGAIIVDTTRKGKRFPDSLSKTIPIWCAVLNNCIASFKSNWDLKLYCSSTSVSDNEKHEIQELIPKFMEKLQNANVDLAAIAEVLKKPLRPMWIHPGTRMFSNHDESDVFWTDEELINLPFYPVICLSASISISIDDRQDFIFPPRNFEYIQGAGDDSETWAPKFTPRKFWKVIEYIDDRISTGELTEIIENVILENEDELQIDGKLSNDFDWIGNTGIAIGNRSSAAPPQCWENFDLIINCGASKYEYPDDSNIAYLEIAEGKKGQHQLYNCIPPALELVKLALEKNSRILIHCMQGLTVINQGIDRSVGISLAVLLRYMDQNNQLNPKIPFVTDKTKMDVLNCLLFIKKFRPKAAPSRATMKRINEFFVRKQE